MNRDRSVRRQEFKASPLWLLVVATCSLAIGTLAGMLVFPEAHLYRLGPMLQPGSGKAAVGGPFSLVDQDGRQVSEQDFRGRYVVMMFGDTRDSEATPALLQAIASALKALGPKSLKLHVLFVALDEQAGSGERMAKLLAGYVPRARGLSGTREAVAAVAKQFRVAVPHRGDRQATDPDRSLASALTAPIYLMNPNGDYVAHWQQSDGVDVLVGLLDGLL